MTTVAGLGGRLRQAREWAGFSQQEAADAIGVAREVISYWENERRTPGLVQLSRLADAFGTTTHHLLDGEAPAHREADQGVIYQGIDASAAHTRAEVRRWLAFLNDWADLLAECDEPLPGRRVPPRREWRSAHAITDTRLAPKLAAAVREHYALGEDAIPDLLAFLDQQGILVYRTALDEIGEGEGISGIFYNHPRLGYAILVNTCTTPGRQTFTLAHEYAHALFHYQERGLVSRTRDPDRKERFANDFAAHFLVPGEKLRELVAQNPDGGGLSPFDVLRLHRYFRVSYATMLNRLRDERLLTQEQYDIYRGYSPSVLANRLGLDCTEYFLPQGNPGVTLATYPPSILERVRRLVEDEELSPVGAADLLRVSQEEVREELLTFAVAKEEEEREFDELPAPATSRPKRKASAGW
jgi:Zn-dependent peptidase ImmA (M78 family)/transcriptional regulator with XRE-family HTH domain